MALEVKVGSFVKSVGAAPAAQSVTGFGFEPNVIYFWTAGGDTTDVWVDDNVPLMGIIDPSFGRRFSTNYINDGGTGNAALHHTTGNGGPLSFITSAGAQTAFGTVNHGADGFDINWTTNDANPYLIHYLALGGSQVLGADNLLTTPPAGPGSQARTGLGFQPQSVFMFPNESDGAGAINYGFGAYQTGATNQAFLRAINTGGPFAAATDQTTSKIVETIGASSGTVAYASTISSLDADGFTLNWTSIGAGFLFEFTGFRGPIIKVGTFNKATGAAPATQVVTGLGFTPKMLLLYSTVQGTGINTSAGRFGFGATTTLGAAAMALQIQDNVSPVNSAAVDSSTKAFIKANNDTKTVDASATLTSFDSDGFTLSWGVNDAVATPLLYIAFGAWSTPTAVTGAANAITPISATLNGTVNPQGGTVAYPTSYKFEYGLTAAYGSSTTPVNNLTGSGNVAASTAIAGLLSNTTYHFRVVAFNGGETINGADQTFTTLMNDIAIWVI